MTPGKEARFRGAEEQAHRVEGKRPDTKAMPAETMPHVMRISSDPEAGADLLHREIARHLEEHVGQIEETTADAERRMRQADIVVHLQRCEAGVHAIHEGDEIADHQERHEAPSHPTHRGLFEIGRRCCGGHRLSPGRACGAGTCRSREDLKTDAPERKGGVMRMGGEGPYHPSHGVASTSEIAAPQQGVHAADAKPAGTRRVRA